MYVYYNICVRNAASRSKVTVKSTFYKRYISTGYVCLLKLFYA